MVKRKHIVILDNSPTSRKILEVALRRENYTVESFSDPHQLLDTLFIVQERPDLLLLDLNLPHMSGFQVIQHIRKRPVLDRIPIFIVTGQRGLRSRVRAWMIGVNEYVAKPFKVQKITALVQDYL